MSMLREETEIPESLAELARRIVALDPEVRVRAALALAEIVEDSATHIERLHATLGEGSPWIRYYLWKLRHVGKRAGVPVTLEDTSDRSVEGVAIVARTLLDRIAAATVSLERALDDEEDRVRQAALRGLRVLGPDLLLALRERHERSSGPATDGGGGGAGSADEQDRGDLPPAPGPVDEMLGGGWTPHWENS